MAPTVIAFDLYGTLLSTGSIAQKLETFYGHEQASVIATKARQYQLEYTWRISTMGMYRSFSDLTRMSFRQATAEAGVTLSEEQEEGIMHAYDGLDTFPEIDDALAILADSPSLDPWVFSNGTFDMITSSMRTSPSLNKAGGLSSSAKVVSVDPLRVFKPDPRTYEHMCRTAASEALPGEVWLVSSNPFDIAGAAAFGMQTAWVDRGNMGWIDGLGAATDLKPTVVVKGVDEAVREILKHSHKG